MDLAFVMDVKKEKPQISIKLGNINDFTFVHTVVASEDFSKWCTSDYWDGFNASYKNELEAADVNNDHVGIGLINGKKVAIFSGRVILDKIIGVHIYILPKYRKYSFQLSLNMINWAKNNIPGVEMLVAEIPEFNLPAIQLAKTLKFKLISWSDKVLKKGGKKWKLYLFMLSLVSKEDIYNSKYHYIYGGDKNA